MSVFLTPDLRPFYGGTYFPPQDAHGRPGFVSVLRGIDSAYRERRNDVEQTANQLAGILRDLAEPEGPGRTQARPGMVLRMVLGMVLGMVRLALPGHSDRIVTQI